LISLISQQLSHKIYFDYGDQTLDAMYKPFQEKVDIVMTEKGFTEKRNF
jgi:hypothetical protein